MALTNICYTEDNAYSSASLFVSTFFLSAFLFVFQAHCHLFLLLLSFLPPSPVSVFSQSLRVCFAEQRRILLGIPAFTRGVFIW